MTEPSGSWELVIVARLLDSGVPVPLPGDSYAISIMRYEVLAVVEGRYLHPVAFVGHDAPDIDAPAFMPGAKHLLRLTRTFPSEASVVDGFAAESRDVGTFYCVSFEVLDG
jgi:hypothetical protein